MCGGQLGGLAALLREYVQDRGLLLRGSAAALPGGSRSVHEGLGCRQRSGGPVSLLECSCRGGRIPRCGVRCSGSEGQEVANGRPECFAGAASSARGHSQRCSCSWRGPGLPTATILQKGWCGSTACCIRAIVQDI